MSKKGVRIVITGAQRRTIEVEAMTQIVIALGRELAAREPKQLKPPRPVASAEVES
jgi:hypothetical protein